MGGSTNGEEARDAVVRALGVEGEAHLGEERARVAVLEHEREGLDRLPVLRAVDHLAEAGEGLRALGEQREQRLLRLGVVLDALPHVVGLQQLLEVQVLLLGHARGAAVQHGLEVALEARTRRARC